MPKIKGTLADVSTEYQYIEPGVYEMRIEKVEAVEEDANSSGKEHDQLYYEIVSRVDEPGTDHHNKPVHDRIYWYKKDGTENEYSKIALKRYFEAALGEGEADRDDLDTDELQGARIRAQVGIRSYTKRDGTQGQSNEIKNVSPL